MMLAGEPDIGWKNATEKWGPYWRTYRYCTIAINCALVIWTIANIIFILTKGRKLVSRKYFISLNLMVWIYAITKLIYYSVDPRGLKQIMPPLAGSLLLNTNFPTLTVGFCMLYVALRQCTIPNRHLLPLILKTKCIVIFIAICFVVSYLTDILVAHFHSLQLMIIVCQLFYILWGFLFSGFYTALVIQYRNAVRKARKKMERSCYRRGHCRRGFDKRNMKEIPVCVKITCVTAVLFFLFALLNIFIVLVEIGLFNDTASMKNMCNGYRQTWNFFIFHSIFAAVEHLMAITLAIAGTQPLKWLRLTAISLAREDMTIPNFSITPQLFSVERDMETSFTDISVSQQTLASSTNVFPTHSNTSPSIPSAK